MRKKGQASPADRPLSWDDIKRLQQDKTWLEGALLEQGRKRATKRAHGTAEAEHFMQQCLYVAQQALNAYAMGATEYRSVINEWHTIERRRIFGCKIGPKHTVESVEKNWKFFEVQLLDSVELHSLRSMGIVCIDKKQQAVGERYVLALKTRAPWVKESLRNHFASLGYKSTGFLTLEERSYTELLSNSMVYVLPSRIKER